MLTKPNDDKLGSNNKTSLNKLNKHQKNIISPTKNNNTITNNNTPSQQPINMKSIMLSLKNNTIDYLKT